MGNNDNIYLSFSRIDGTPYKHSRRDPYPSFGGLPFVGYHNMSENELLNCLIKQVTKYRDWIINNGGEKVEIGVTINNMNDYATVGERLEKLKGRFDISAIEAQLSSILT